MNDLHRQLGEIEMAALKSLCALMTSREREALGLYCRQHGGALVLACEAEQGILFNRTIGLLSPQSEQVDEILDVYRTRAIARAFISVEADQLDVMAGALQERGLQAARPWCKFVRDTAPAPATSTELELRIVNADHGEAFGRIVCDAFDLPAGFVPVLARLTEQPGWTVFMSFDGGTPAGGGALFQQDEQAWLGFGATAPAHRRRGSQGAIVAARVRHALEKGARLLSTETGDAVPGDPQHSWKNIMRSGFAPLYRLHNFEFRP